jgi:hypothetical protein
VNAIDPRGKVGVLIGNEVEGGTIGRVIGAQREKDLLLFTRSGWEN